MTFLTKNNGRMVGKLIAISIGIVYLWFGVLKFFPELSPAEDLAKNTIHYLTFGLIPSKVSIKLLAILETGIGLFLFVNVYRKLVIYAALGHMLLTFTPLIFFSGDVFNTVPFSLTLLGQYIVKNLIIIAALLALYQQYLISKGQIIPVSEKV